MKRCLIVFAKEPQKGKVKTRLRTVFDDGLCLRLYKAFLRDTVALAQKVTCEERVIAYDSTNSSARYLKKIALSFNFYRQRGSDLGERMHNAFIYAQKIGAKKTVVIGSDSPDLHAQYIADAFQELERADVVVGPCKDGGYYLIGLKYPCARLFQGVKWSSAGVMRATLKNAKELKMKVILLNKWYDIDTPESLACLELNVKNSGAARYTRRILQCMNLKALTP